MGHMEKVSDMDLIIDQPHFYFPHHPVLRPDSTSTKLRTVFNGSAATSSGLSLNDVLLTGPTIQQDIFNILLRFRCHKVVLTGDIQKMFRQIMVHKDDRNLQLILWRFSTEQAVHTYRLNTVTYGTCSAPYLAARCLHQLGKEFQQVYPEACKIILNDFYMDDVVTGHEDNIELMRIKQELVTIFTSAGFELHKWKSNEISITKKGDGDEISKILGILWNTTSDSLGYAKDIDEQAGTTKRNILSEVQKIFDPLGIVSPIVVLGKIIMQDIWSIKVKWDEELPTNIISEWKRFCYQLKDIERIEFPRHVRSKAKIVEIHGFSDAAKRAYGAAIYIRTVSEDDSVKVSLLCAKSRVTPTSENGNLEDVTIPRMELRAASLLVDLTTKVMDSLSILINGIHYWTDSMVTLEWLRNPNRSRPAFISNRVKAINEKTSITSWHHVRSKDNPADLISRGASARKLLACTNWWNGPTFLTEHNQHWPLECNTAVCSMVTTQEEVTGETIRVAHKKIIVWTQWRYYEKEMSCLTTNKLIPSSSTLLTLNPFVDSDGLMRVRGRIQAAGVSYDQQHPIILPPKSNLTLTIIRHYHTINLHVGMQSLPE
ncbi:uncharacterized protein LOC129750780 [Uranotaenia lowii]|uniref:uncharacterized protein LOC129750780 n=1 Tax=Uranotaenia lowii TaxID=190385 RepID=UPI00247A330C|nr:uncharacterized protein LOC129750780 [Uranotaenia lowii]